MPPLMYGVFMIADSSSMNISCSQFHDHAWSGASCLVYYVEIARKKVINAK